MPKKVGLSLEKFRAKVRELEICAGIKPEDALSIDECDLGDLERRMLKVIEIIERDNILEARYYGLQLHVETFYLKRARMHWNGWLLICDKFHNINLMPPAKRLPQLEIVMQEMREFVLSTLKLDAKEIAPNLLYQAGREYLDRKSSGKVH